MRLGGLRYNISVILNDGIEIISWKAHKRELNLQFKSANEEYLYLLNRDKIINARGQNGLMAMYQNI